MWHLWRQVGNTFWCQLSWIYFFQKKTFGIFNSVCVVLLNCAWESEKLEAMSRQQEGRQLQCSRFKSQIKQKKSRSNQTCRWLTFPFASFSPSLPPWNYCFYSAVKSSQTLGLVWSKEEKVATALLRAEAAAPLVGLWSKESHSFIGSLIHFFKNKK